jgi:hypothetical protein
LRGIAIIVIEILDKALVGHQVHIGEITEIARTASDSRLNLFLADVAEGTRPSRDVGEIEGIGAIF